jgi:predicted nuclease of predicted toxin-antitoxin system
MSGTTNYLNKGQRLVVDTMLLKRAAKYELEPSADDSAWRLLKLILDVCPQVFISRRQRDEIVPRFNTELRRRIEQTAFFRNLDEAGKARQVSRSKSTSKPLDQAAIRFLRQIDSESDRHLFETARVLDKILLTADIDLLENRAELLKLTGVTVLECEDVLGD